MFALAAHLAHFGDPLVAPPPRSTPTCGSTATCPPWRRTIITLSRSLRPLQKAYGVRLRISYGKVAEYRRRGVVHFHALIRLDEACPTIRIRYSPHQR